MDRFEPEFLLLVRCCQWNFASGGQVSPPEIPDACDWHRVVALARRHRVQGLVWSALAPLAGQMPDDAKEALSSEARSIAATNLGIAAECQTLLDAFEKAQIPLLFVKGLTVAALAYRSPLLKMGWDIDLLIDPKDLPQASDLLSNLGYSLRLPADKANLSAWHRRSKESVWNRNDSYFVELHTALTDSHWLLPSINVHSPQRPVEVAPSVSLPTLTDHELLTYLSVHGAWSAWFRLKWIADFAALLANRSEDELERLYDRSLQLGAGRAFGQALLVADRLFGVLGSIPKLRQRSSGDRAMRFLCGAALKMMTNGVVEPTEKAFGTLPIHGAQLLLRPELGFKLSELSRKAGLLLKRP